ncbi:MAG: hypothetical protein WC696_06155 [Candidatus Methylopumilus sp.]|jgi:hypothetical protein
MNQKKSISTLLFILFATITINSLADDNNDLNKRMIRPGMGVQSLPINGIQPVQSTPVINNPGTTQSLNPQPFPPAENAPTKIAPAPINSVPNQALPPMQPAAAPQLPAATNNMNGQMASPASGLGLQGIKPMNGMTAQEIRISNQSWDDLKNQPDNTVLILPDGKRVTIADVKQQRSKIQPSRINNRNNIATKSLNVKHPPVGTTVDVRAILQQESAAAASAVQAAGMATKLVSMCNPCISTINGKAINRAVFTPSSPDVISKVTIKGGGFGDQKPEIYLTGAFNKRPVLRVDTWRDDQITAFFEAGLSGEPDQDGVGLVVNLANGKQITTAASAKFYAARAEQTIDFNKIPDSRIKFDSSSSLVMQRNGKGYSGNKHSQHGESNMARGLTDMINLEAQGLLKPGFEVVAATANIIQPQQNSNSNSNECAGGQYSWGDSDIQWIGDSLQIKRPMGGDHTSPNYNPISLCGNGGDDSTDYFSGVSDIKIYVSGPVGISPLK